jgi:hypothetical protein
MVRWDMEEGRKNGRKIWLMIDVESGVGFLEAISNVDISLVCKKYAEEGRGR